MQISELARLTGVTVHALRHYERAGLLHPERLPNGYRNYAPAARREVVFIAMSRALGFGVPQIRSLLLAWRRGHIGPGGLADVVQARADDIQAQIAALQAQHQQALDHVQWLRARQAEQDKRQRPAANGSPSRAPWPRVRRAPPTPSQGDRP
ncbi:MerR family DNA-binding transcriptional regulator [Acidovorax sp.]|uniref:MerR family DNA-binding transcriptional regulator n=1 Tax=Acidovorax sp. TaxID=1872122 RepID=UPI0026049C59|nr:MerR family DNA-binding transcriptional regulator [Acidovorax sp.]